jgi:hypothetical protein
MRQARIVLKTTCCLTVTFLLYLGYKVLTNFGSEPAQKITTQATMREMLSSVMKYRHEYHRWPIGLNSGALLFINESTPEGSSAYSPKWMMREGRPMDDAWGTPFFISVSDDRFTLISAGPDGMTNTVDDITGLFSTDKMDAAWDDIGITIIDSAEKTTRWNFFTKQREHP